MVEKVLAQSSYSDSEQANLLNVGVKAIRRPLVACGCRWARSANSLSCASSCSLESLVIKDLECHRTSLRISVISQLKSATFTHKVDNCYKTLLFLGFSPSMWLKSVTFSALFCKIRCSEFNCLLIYDFGSCFCA